jgi:hypothetical protein
MTTRANEAVVDILLKTGCYVTSATMTETSGTGDYTLDTGIMRVKGWQWSDGSTYSQPERVPIDVLLALRGNNSASTTWPASFYAVAGANLLMVYPTPAASDTITVYYTPVPTAMSSGSHDPSSATYGGIPVGFHPAIEQYMLWKLASADDDESSGQGERYRIAYEGQQGDGGWIKTIRKYTLMHGGKPSRVRVNGRRRPFVQHDNSRY